MASLQVWTKSHKVKNYESLPHLQDKLPVGLFLVFTGFIAFPLFDIPLLGLSLSAPLLFLIALEVIIRPQEKWFTYYATWIKFAILIWIGIAASALASGMISGGVNFDTTGIKSLIQFAYWLLAFVITIYVISRAGIEKKITTIIAFAVVALSSLRWIEVLLLGKMGAWTGTEFLSQNDYGFLFSTFAPFPFIFLFERNRRRKLLAIFGIFVFWGAVAINGSRSSWITVSASLLIFVFLLMLSNPKRALGFLPFTIITGGLLALILLSSSSIASAVNTRLATFQHLDQDKSYAIRLLMNQKGWKLFKESPLFGVGVSRFRKSSIELEIPYILSYAPQSHFDVKSSHNAYVSFLAETGLAGCLPYGILLVVLLFRGVKASIVLAKQGHYWGLVIFTSFITMSIHLWSLSGLTGTLPWFIYGLLASVVFTTSQKNNSAPLLIERNPYLKRQRISRPFNHLR